jgi:hypothetical protein
MAISVNYPVSVNSALYTVNGAVVVPPSTVSLSLITPLQSVLAGSFRYSSLGDSKRQSVLTSSYQV